MDLSAIYSDRLRLIKEGLSIVNRQAFTWATFEASVKAALDVSPTNGDASRGLSLYPSLPAALDNELQRALFRVEACRALLESVEALYAVLSDKQRRLADRLLLPVLSAVLTTGSEMQGRSLAA